MERFCQQVPPWPQLQACSAFATVCRMVLVWPKWADYSRAHREKIRNPFIQPLPQKATLHDHCNQYLHGRRGDCPAGPTHSALPPTRIVLAIAFFMVPFLLIQGAATHFFDVKLYSRMGQLLGAVVGCLSYVLYVTKIEKRAVSELALKGALPEYGAGFVLGGLMVCASVASIAAFGGLESMVMAPSSIIILPLLMHLTVGLIQEMVMRGIFFRVVQESIGSRRRCWPRAWRWCDASVQRQHLCAGHCQHRCGWRVLRRSLFADRAPVVVCRFACGLELYPGLHLLVGSVWPRSEKRLADNPAQRPRLGRPAVHSASKVRR